MLAPAEPYQFRRSWILGCPQVDPEALRVMTVESDSLLLTLQDGDVVLVNTASRAHPASLSSSTAWRWSPSGWS